MSANASCCATVDAELKRWDCWDRGDKKTSAKRNKDEIGTGWIMEIHSAGIWSQNGNRILGNVFRQKKIKTKIIGDTMDMKKNRRSSIRSGGTMRRKQRTRTIRRGKWWLTSLPWERVFGRNFFQSTSSRTVLLIFFPGVFGCLSLRTILEHLAYD